MGDEIGNNGGAANGFQIRVDVRDDHMEAYVTLLTEGENLQPVSVHRLEEALKAARIVCGVDRLALFKLASSPVPGVPAVAARGMAPVDGIDGTATFHVRKNDEYHPDFGGDREGAVDYKNVDVFQMVAKDQLLCAITKPTAGKDGLNVYGGVVPARPGREVPSPKGSNTDWIENETKLVATVDGAVNFKSTVIHVNNVLRIEGDVDTKTGNIHFNGDVFIGGDVNSGFEVNCGGDLVVRGSIENADVRVSGNLTVAEGINGGNNREIHVGGSVRCGYIENGILYADGNVVSDYIIDSHVASKGKINLVGQKAVLVGGFTRFFQFLTAKFIGNDRGVRTRIELMASPPGREKQDVLAEERRRLLEEEKEINDKLAKLRMVQQVRDRPELDALKKALDGRIREIKLALQKNAADQMAADHDDPEEFPGMIRCKGKLYQGVEIVADLDVMKIDSDLERSVIYMNQGEWVKGTL